jgi:hypothetical protein
MHIVWFASPNFPWLRPLGKNHISQDIEQAASSPLQISLQEHEDETWSLLEHAHAHVRAAASLVLALQIGHDADQLALMLEAQDGVEDEALRCSLFLAVGRAGQYTGQLYGENSLGNIYRELQAEVNSSSMLSRVFAAVALGVLVGSIPTSSIDALVDALRDPMPLPALWSTEGVSWCEYTSSRVVCTLLAHCDVPRSDELVAALNAVAGRDKSIAQVALQKIQSAR